MRKLLLLLLLLPAGVFAQFTSTARHIVNSASLPATCSPLTGDVYFIESGVGLGVYYCSATNTWSSLGSAGTITTAVTLTANLPVIGAGGSAVAIGTRSGNTTAYVTTTGTQTSGNCVSIDASGNHVANGAGCLSSSDLAGLYFALASNSQSITGVNNTITSSATEAAFEFVAGNIPSSINAGGVGTTSTGRWYNYDGANSQVYLSIAGSGRTEPSAPSAGVLHVAGSTFSATSSLIVAADITAATITAAKMAATTWDAQSDGSTITWAIASVLNAQATVTLGGNRTLNISNPVVGGNYVFRITQDGTGTRTLTKGTGCTWKELGSSAATFGLSTAAAAIDVLTFTYDGTNCLASVGKAYGG